MTHIVPIFSTSLARWLLSSLLLLLSLLAQSPALAVPKTDVVTLQNGDVVTCEIKEMVRGKLQAKTNNMGTLYIEWDKVAHIQSTYWFLVSFRDGSMMYGQMESSDKEGVVTIAFQERARDVRLDSIVEIVPVRYNLWDKFNMSASVGFSWDKGSQVFQSNLDAMVKYNGTLYSWGMDATSMQTDQVDGVTRRSQLDLWLQREISGRLNGNISTGVERNDEMGLRRRISSSLTAGYFLSRSNHVEVKTWLGGSLNREWATDASDPTNNTEGDIGASFTMFYYDSPKSDVTVSMDFYPNFSVSDRWRFEGNISATQEIITNLSVKLSYYESRDTKPPSQDSATADRGIVFGIQWFK